MAIRFHWTGEELVRLPDNTIPDDAGKAGFLTVGGEITIFYDVPLDHYESDILVARCYKIVRAEQVSDAR